MLITHDERRVFRRMEVAAEVIIVKGGGKLAGVCNDLSSTGMSIQLTEPTLQEGDQIRVLLDTQNTRLPPFDVEANVLRIHQQDGFYIAAIEFTTIK